MASVSTPPSAQGYAGKSVQGETMKKLLAVIALALASLPAQAICVYEASETYGGELDAADHVFVAIITQATLAEDPAAVQERAVANHKNKWNFYPINYQYSVLATLKGDPKAVSHLEGRALYDQPDGRQIYFAESIDWQPGDVVLVVAKGSGPVALSFCGPSKPFDWAMSNLREEGRHDLDQFLPAIDKPKQTEIR